MPEPDHNLGKTIFEAAKLQVKLKQGTDKINELHRQLYEIMDAAQKREQKTPQTAQKFTATLIVTNNLIRSVVRANDHAAMIIQGAVDGYEKELRDVEAI